MKRLSEIVINLLFLLSYINTKPFCINKKQFYKNDFTKINNFYDLRHILHAIHKIYMTRFGKLLEKNALITEMFFIFIRTVPLRSKIFNNNPI